MAEDTSQLLRFVLEELRSDREEAYQFRVEVRESLRAQRIESQDFRDEIRERVDHLEQGVAVKDAAEQATSKLLSKQRKTLLGLISLVVTLASALAPFLFTLVVNLFR